MRFVIQRVRSAAVTVEENIVGQIEKGFLVFVGISQTDNEQIADKMVRKLIGLRIFEDAEGKTNLDIKTVSGSLLMVSQFTLYADCKKGNRPSFTHAGAPDKANALYEYILHLCKDEIPVVEKGIFGADMKVSLINDGPFTVILDSDEVGILP
ncbi:MAG: D-tyrosyl-tRNA(Tyr) deacylase [Lachnospiraceae bacterium]|nr:D-tyrosyl-tRNA(Tyr) deacylase [Lachnospiraceae bacterium]